MAPTRPLSYLEVLDDEYWELKGERPSASSQQLRQEYVSACVTQAPDLAARLSAFRADVIGRLHAAGRSALCFSGGGIRSATFGLGVLQALAAVAGKDPRGSVLGQVDYLSTVSGGGYVGAWFSAWATRLSKASPQVAHLLDQPDVSDGPSRVIATLASHEPVAFEPDPLPVRYLREYSNYLTPKLGLTSGDTWSAVGAVVRNLFLNWLVLIPLLAAVLLVPLGARAMLSLQPGSAVLWVALVCGFALGALATAYVGYDLPSAGNAGNRYVWYLWLCLVPLALAAVFVNTFWAWLPDGRERASWWNVVELGRTYVAWWHFAAFGALMHAGGMLLGIGAAMVRFRRPAPRTGLYATAAAGATGAAGALAAFVITRFSHPVENASDAAVSWYICAAFPLVMMVFLFAGALLVGLTSYITEDKDREWWARGGGIALAITLSWPVFAAIVLYAPHALGQLRLGVSTLAAATGLTGWGVAALGSSARTGSGRRDVPSSVAPVRLPGWAMDAISRLALPMFVVLLAMLLAVANRELVLYEPVLRARIGAALLGLGDAVTPGLTPASMAPGVWSVLVVGAAYVALCLGASLFINVNSFSLHAMYRQRLIRAYLGASNGCRQPHPFTGFDETDNLPMCCLTSYRPLHVVNMALNLVGGGRLAWQQRKAESFTSTRLHTGSWCTGYRPSHDYGGRYKKERKKPISLGTAMTISGAAASPNMGYNSSPLLTLVMTLFNARLGWWLGNPKEAPEIWRLPGPRFGVRPFIDEALGLTNDDNAWVYLSDGGHFDNLGLYEMVLRRCRVIILSDAGADPEYTYEDLGNAIRKIRVDLGIALEFDRPMPMTRDSRRIPGVSGHHCAIARIKYSAADPGAADGTLIYLKPSLNGDEPADVQHYAAQDSRFPHQPTPDQFFDEPQFESYRRLGAHVIETILRAPSATGPVAQQVDLAQFVARAREYASGDAPCPADGRTVSNPV